MGILSGRHSASLELVILGDDEVADSRLTKD
jgi:hypothetical protein